MFTNSIYIGLFGALGLATETCSCLWLDGLDVTGENVTTQIRNSAPQSKQSTLNPKPEIVRATGEQMALPGCNLYAFLSVGMSQSCFRGCTLCIRGPMILGAQMSPDW